MEEKTNSTESIVSNNDKTKTVSTESAKNGGNSSSKTVLIIAIVVLVLAALLYLFISLSPETTAKIRDVSIILFVLESVVTVTAIVVLIVQITKLVNFLKYEISPILNTTGKTVKKFSGTVSFLCENAVEPTVEAASTLSGIKNAANGVLSFFKK